MDIPPLKIADGPFDPAWGSLMEYECPDWFRDAKFGIWAHWSPQTAPELGDWYARHMYVQGHLYYQQHVSRYGHPSVFGYKDICNAWKAERWDPDGLMSLYRKAGARYFVGLANHHDNFDCWDSAWQPWNSVNVGPKRDIIGEWARCARDQGLRFGVTVHATPGRTWNQFMPMYHGSDQYGPLAGVPYDGALTAKDGKGTWWDGLDPRDLYGEPHVKEVPPSRRFIRQFLHRVDDLFKYRPDLLYFDDAMVWEPDLGIHLGLPDLAPQITAHYYNSNMKWHDGKLEAVLNIKGVPENMRKPVVQDFEIRRSRNLEPYPWQTDTTTGEWHYRRGQSYRSVSDIIHEIVDVVSKNGNVLLNVPPRADGTLDEHETAALEEIGTWMAMNGEAIYGSRPWKMHGASTVRFTTRSNALYAIALEWPSDRRLAVPQLPTQAGGKIERISLLGDGGSLEYTRDYIGLLIELPAEKPCGYAYVFKLEGKELIS